MPIAVLRPHSTPFSHRHAVHTTNQIGDKLSVVYFLHNECSRPRSHFTTEHNFLLLAPGPRSRGCVGKPRRARRVAVAASKDDMSNRAKRRDKGRPRRGGARGPPKGSGGMTDANGRTTEEGPWRGWSEGPTMTAAAAAAAATVTIWRCARTKLAAISRDGSGTLWQQRAFINATGQGRPEPRGGGRRLCARGALSLPARHLRN